MIYADIDKEELEYEGDGQKLLSEIAMVLGSSIVHMAIEKGMSEKETTGVIEMIMEALTDIVQGTVISTMRDQEEGGTDDEEEVCEERSRESVPTTIKKFRRARK